MEARKEYFVKLYQHEDDSYNELWKTKDNKYFVRNTFYGGEWYYVCDPLGYCELDHACPSDIIFHVCDPKYNELFISRNDGCEFPCLRVLLKQEWDKVRPFLEVKEEDASANFYVHALTGGNPSGLANWLLTFKDPDLYGDKAKDYDENWTMFQIEEVEREALSKFHFVGIECTIEKIKMRHTICNVEWYEYYTAGTYMGAEFNQDSVGDMYSKGDATQMVVDSLYRIYPDAGRHLSVINFFADTKNPYETKYTITQAAELLLNRNLHRTHVEGAIENEAKNHTFYTDDEVRRLFPNCVRDYNYSW